MRALRRLVFPLGVAATAASSAALVVFGVGAVVPQAGATRSPPPVPHAQSPAAPPAQAVSIQGAACLPPPGDAQIVAGVFLRTAVLRQNPVCSYELVTKQMRQGLSRQEWATGNIPVQPFPTERPGTLRVQTQVAQEAPAQRVLVVTMQAADLGMFVFEVILVRRDDQWLVNYFQPKGMPPVPAAG